MSDYILVSDSTGDLPADVVERIGVEIIPFNFTMENKTYRNYPDHREISIKDFYDKIRAGAMPVTSQINPAEYEDYLNGILQKDKDVIYICFSSGLSGSYQNAVIAADTVSEKNPGRRITVIDSRCASLGEGALIYGAAEKRDAGLGYDELIEWVEANKNNVSHWFSVENLFHLKRGGRVSAVEAVVGSALKIKPILTVDNDGKLAVRSKARGTANALNYLIQKAEEECNPEKTVFFIGTADAPERAQKLKETLISKGLGRDYIICDVGPVIGAHVGPGMCVLAYFTKNTTQM